MKRSSLLFFSVFCGLFFGMMNASAQTGKVVRGGVLNGKAIRLTKPDYPPAARAVSAGGTVSVQITIDEQGNVVSASAVSGHPLLKASSEKAALASKFSPTRLSGEAVKVTGILVYNFASEGKEININTQPEEIEEEALNGLAIKLPSPEYPPSARAVSAKGKVRVNVSLDDKGNVVSATAVAGHPLLRTAAEKAAKEAKFNPADVKSQSEGTLIYVFFALPKENKN